MNDIMKIVKFFEESGLLIKDVSEAIKSQSEEQKGEFLSMLQSASGDSFLGKLSKVKGTIRTDF